MLRQRIIAKILIDEVNIACKFRRFTEGHRVVGDPITTMRTLEDQRVDEFQVVFLGPVDVDLVRDMTRVIHTPVTVAGSINSMETVDALISGCGVEKVVMKDGAEAASKYGRQAIVWPFTYEGDGAFARVPWWAGEVVATSVDRDGMGDGMDIGVLRFPWSVPVVISGGVGKLSHVKEAFDAGASGVAVASMFPFTSRGPVMLRSWLLTQGANVRAA